MGQCTVRKDLLDSGLSVPFRGKDGLTLYTDSTESFETRWLNEDTDLEQFQLLYLGNWLNAESIDFEHINRIE